MHAAPRASAWPSASGRFLIIAGLTGFAISQPLLSILGDDPTTLTHHDVQGGKLVLLAGLIVFVPPILLWLAVTLATLADRRAGRVVHLVVVAALVGLLTIQVAKSAGLEQRVVLIATATIIGVAFAVGHIRVRSVATWAAYTAILPVLAFAFFLLASPSSALLSSAREGPARVDGAGRDQPPVVFIVLDEFPTRSLMDEAGAIDGARFPNLAAFSEDSTWYRHHTSFSPFTAAAVPSLLTGQLPSTDPPLWTSHPNSLFTLLAPTHELEVFETVTNMCPFTSCGATATASDGTQRQLGASGPSFGDLLGVTADLWVDRVTPGPQAPPALDDFAEEIQAPELASPPTGSSAEAFGGFSDDAMRGTGAPAQDLIDSLDAEKGAALYYLHVMLPHQPWGRYPDGELYAVADAIGITLPKADQGVPFSWSDWIGAVSEQRHLLQAQYADQLVGQIMGALKDEGLYEDSMVVVVGDHGISFESRTVGRQVARSTIDAIAYSPLLIKTPNQQTGAIDDASVSAIDVVPTIADTLGLPLDWEVDGAPVTSDAVAARGDTKEIYDLTGLAQLTLDEILEYSDTETFPSVARGWIGDLPDADDPISGLNALLDLDGIIGTELDSLDPTDGGEVLIERLVDLERPPTDRFPLGVVTGRVPDAPQDATLVLALNGVIVGGSKLSTDSAGLDGRIAVVLPQGVQQQENDVRAALLVDGGWRELEIIGT